MEDRINRAVWSRRIGQRGFTLIELLVVIAVLAILAVVVLFNVTGVRNKGQAASCSTDIKTLQTAIDAYANDTGKTSGGMFSVAGIDAMLTSLGDGHTATVTAAAPAGQSGLIFAAAFAGMPTASSTFSPAYIHFNTTGCTTGITVAQADGKDDNNGFTVAGT